MRHDILFRNGTVFNPPDKRLAKADLAVSGTKISAVGDLSGDNASVEYDAAGKLVLPGLIDFHIHLFTDGSDEGVPADLALLPYGVTSAVEGGTCGVSTYEAFRRLTFFGSLVSIKANLNVSSLGIINPKFPENADPERYETERLLDFAQRYRSELYGLKLRYSLDIDPHIRLDSLDCCLELAERAGLPLVVHVTNPPVDMEDIAKKLRPGDVFCHCFQSRGKSTILNDGGSVKDEIIDAQRRGVIFDASNGSSNYSHEIAGAAIRNGFFPDIISTDASHAAHSYLKPRCSALPYLMSKYLALGMPLLEILTRVTLRAADFAGWPGKGRLEPGCDADVAVFDLKEHKTVFEDSLGQNIEGGQMFVPIITVKNGTVVYRQMTA